MGGDRFGAGLSYEEVAEEVRACPADGRSSLGGEEE